MSPEPKSSCSIQQERSVTMEEQPDFDFRIGRLSYASEHFDAEAGLWAGANRGLHYEILVHLWRALHTSGPQGAQFTRFICNSSTPVSFYLQREWQSLQQSLDDIASY